MAYTALGTHCRESLSVRELANRFPDEEAARIWCEAQVWPHNARRCPHCGHTDTQSTPHAQPMPYWCSVCRRYFSVRTRTAMARSRVALRKWVWAIHLCAISLQGVSSMQLHRDLKVTQKTAWFMLRRLREAWQQEGAESCFGGQGGNKPTDKKRNAAGEQSADGFHCGGRGRPTSDVSRTDRPEDRMPTAENKDFAGAAPETLARALCRQVSAKTEPAQTPSFLVPRHHRRQRMMPKIKKQPIDLKQTYRMGTNISEAV